MVHISFYVCGEPAGDYIEENSLWIVGSQQDDLKILLTTQSVGEIVRIQTCPATSPVTTVGKS